MSVAGAKRVFGVGGADALQIVPARRVIDAADLHYAHECRGRGWGWQAIALQLRVNVLDLRRACGALTEAAVAAMPAPRKAAKTAKPPPLPRGRPIDPMRAAGRVAVLRALAPAAASVADLVAKTGLIAGEVHAAIGTLRKKGLLEGNGRSGGALRLTDAGQRTVDALEAVGHD